MAQVGLNKLWWIGLANYLMIAGAIALSEEYAIAQTQPDSTLGDESSVVNPVNVNSDRIEGGAIRGSNLLHSFQEFNVGEGKAVYFANPQGIENIFNRVTGKNPSQILGKLGVLGNANLFLLNPNGIIFGENASLDVNGSFVATTANAVQFGSQGIFSATSPETPSLLTVNPSALLFNQINQNAEIQNNSKVPAGRDPGGVEVLGLRVPNGKSLLLVGGNVSMDGGWAIASGGHIELGGLTEAGSIGIQNNGSNFSLSFPDGVQRGDISLTNGSIVGVIADGGGSIAANARNLEILAGSKFSAGIGLGLGTTNAQAGDITINTRNLIVRDSQLGSIIYGEGNAGDFKVIASDSVELSGEIPSDEKGFPGGILATLDVTGKGKSGNIYLETRRLSVSDGSKVQTATFGEGDADNLFISANEIEVFETEKPNFYSTGIFAAVGFDPRAVKLSKGNGGNLTIETRNLSIRNGGYIDVSTQGEGNGGQLFIKASDSIEVTGESPYASEISAEVTDQGIGNGGSITIETPKLTVKDGGLITSSTFGKGNAGNINIKTGSLSTTNGSQINSFTRGQGNAGDITIQATDAVTFDGVDSNGDSSALFTSVEAGAVGRGGNININARNIFIRDGGLITSSTLGKGDSGNISITANNAISLDASSYILNSVQDREAEGNAGKIDITTGSLSVTNGSQINSFTRGQGNAGDITIQARDAVTFDGFSDKDYSSLSSSVLAGGIGNGGNINLTARSLSLTDGAEVEVRVRAASDTLPGGQGKGGTINVNVDDTLTIAGGNIPGIIASLGTGAVGRGGDIKIQAGNIFIRDGGEINSGTLGKGDSGNISITADNAVSIDTGRIYNNVQDSDAEGNAGKIDITTGSLSVTNGAQIVSSTGGKGNGGNITIQAKDTVSFDDLDSNPIFTGVIAGVDAGAVGNSGNINITARSLSLTNGALEVAVRGETDTLPSGQGKGGILNVNVSDALTISGSNSVISASLDTDAVGLGGDIKIQAGNVFLKDGGQIDASTDGKGNSGNIFLTASGAISMDRSIIANLVLSSEAEGNAGKINITTGSLSLTNGSQITSLTRGQGNAGDINIQARDAVTFDGVRFLNNRSNIFYTGLFSSVDPGAVGNGGNINITAGSLSLTNGGKLNASIDEASNSLPGGKGQGGSVNVNVDDALTISGSGSEISGNLGTGAVGRSGDIKVRAGNVFVKDGARINSFTSGRGNAGNIVIAATDAITFDGKDRNETYSALLNSVLAGGVGDGGKVEITAGSFSLTNGAFLDAGVREASSSLPGGQGNGSNVNISVRDALTISGANASGIFASLGDTAEGRSGNININAGNIFIRDGGEISSSTLGKGDSGNISITVDDAISLDATSFIINNVQSSDAEGNARKIDITTGSLSVTNGSQINSFTRGKGNAGDITIQARDAVTFDGMGSNGFPSRLSSSVLAGANGDGGDIDITAGSLFINDGAEISANTESIGNAGNININVLETLEANNGEVSTSSTQSSGGGINITAGALNLRGDSDIRSNVSSGAGGGGNINITADSIIAFDDSDIFAFASDGQGGNISLNTPAYFGNGFTPSSFQSNPDSLNNNDRADINATGAVSSGAVSLPDVSFIQNSLADLPDSAINTENLIANSCVVQSREQEGKFIITGADGLPESPTDNSISPYPTGEVRNIRSRDSSWQKGDPIVEPQGVYELENGRAIATRECSQ